MDDKLYVDVRQVEALTAQLSTTKCVRGPAGFACIEPGCGAFSDVWCCRQCGGAYCRSHWIRLNDETGLCKMCGSGGSQLGTNCARGHGDACGVNGCASIEDVWLCKRCLAAFCASHWSHLDDTTGLCVACRDDGGETQAQTQTRCVRGVAGATCKESGCGGTADVWCCCRCGGAYCRSHWIRLNDESGLCMMCGGGGSQLGTSCVRGHSEACGVNSCGSTKDVWLCKRCRAAFCVSHWSHLDDETGLCRSCKGSSVGGGGGQTRCVRGAKGDVCRECGGHADVWCCRICEAGYCRWHWGQLDDASGLCKGCAAEVPSPDEDRPL